MCDKEKNSAKVFVSVASLTIASKRVNVCWLHAGVYDQFLCQFFRGVLYYALAFVKQYTKKQKYFVSKNFKLRTYKTKSGNQYRKVLLEDFAIGRHPRNRADSSDDELEYSSEEEEEEGEKKEEGKKDQGEEEEEDEEVFNFGGVPIVEIPVGIGMLRITHHVDGTTVMIQPPRFDSVLATVELGRVMSELDLMRSIRANLDMIITAQEEIQRDLEALSAESE